jgi:hypothetical protein
MTLFYNGVGEFVWVGLANCDICRKEINQIMVVRQEVKPGNNIYLLCLDCAKKTKNRDFGLKQQITATIIEPEELAGTAFPVTFRIPNLVNTTQEAILESGGMTNDKTKFAKYESLESATIGKAIPDRSYMNDTEIPTKEVDSFFKDSTPVLPGSKKLIGEKKHGSS